MWPPVRRYAHAGHDLRVVVDQRQHAGVLQRHEVLLQVAGAIPLVRMRRIFPFAAMRDVPRASEIAARCARRRSRAREAADVIEMQMAGDDDVDVVGATGRLRRASDRGGSGDRARRCPRSSRPSCRRIPASISIVCVAADEQRPHAERDPVPIVRRQRASPTAFCGTTPNIAPPSSRKNPSDSVIELEIAERVPAGVSEPRHRRRRLLQLDQHAMRGRRVNERHARAFGARPGDSVDQADAARLEIRQRRVDVLHAQRHVVHARRRASR